MSDTVKAIVGGIILILALFWLFNPASQSPMVISALSSGTIGTIQALQGFSVTGGGTFYGGQNATKRYAYQAPVT